MMMEGHNMNGSQNTALIWECYAYYVAECCFSTCDCFPIVGRVAVPFLMTSNLHKDVLKQLWSQVDREGVDSLFDIQQWMTLLRGIANVQQQPFPTFSNLTSVPPHSLLLSKYQHRCKSSQYNPQQEAQPAVSISDAFQDLVVDQDKPLPSLSQPIEQKEVGDDNIESKEDNYNNIDMHDEFGDFEEVTTETTNDFNNVKNQ